VDPRAEEGFVRIDIAQPRHQSLIQEYALDRSAAAGQALLEA
jgi:hypothetical protein